jgi:MFS family permease
VEGGAATVHGTLTTGAFLTGYLLYLGASDLELALVSAAPLMAQIVQVAGAWLVVRTGRRKLLVAVASVAGRSLWLPLALAPLAPAEHRIGLFLLGYLASAIAANIASPAWLAWMSDLVPPRVRGRYFGFRNRVVGIVTMAASLFAGFLLDAARRQGAEGVGWFLILLIAVSAGLCAFGLILRQPDPVRSPPVSVKWLAPWRNGAYGRVLVFYIYWLFAIGLASPFYTAHLLKNRDWDFRGLAAIGIIASGVGLVCNPGWGRAIDRYGHRPVLLVSAVGILHLPLYYALCPAGTAWPIYLDAVLTGVFWSGFNLAIFSLLMDDLPMVGKPYYFAFAAAMSGVVNFAASVCGGWLAQIWGDAEVALGGLSLGNYQLLFLLTTAVRLPGIALIGRIREPDAKPSAVLIRQAFIEINRRIGLGRQVVLLPSAKGEGAGRDNVRKPSEQRPPPAEPDERP